MIRITDEHNRVLDLNGPDLNIALQLDFIPKRPFDNDEGRKRNQRKHDGGRGDGTGKAATPLTSYKWVLFFLENKRTKKEYNEPLLPITSTSSSQKILDGEYSLLSPKKQNDLQSQSSMTRTILNPYL